MRKKVSNRQAGFSLLELMVVVTIVGIIAAIAMPNFQRFQSRARVAEAKQNLGAYYTAAKASYSEWNVYLGNFVAVGFRPEGRLAYRVTALNTGAMPSGFFGPSEATCVSTGLGPTDCDATAVDGVAWSLNWEEALAPTAVVPSAPDATCSLGTTNSTFSICASGRHQGSPVVDTWQIDERKEVTNTMAGI